MAVILTDNEFFTGLSNLPVLARMYATNTSDKPQMFVDAFTTETLEYGDQKIFTFSNLPTVKEYNPVSTLLTVTKVDTNQETIKLTEHKVIPSSYNAYILKSAFTDADGMNQFTGYLLSQMESAKIDYIYDVIRDDLFNKVFTGTKQNKEIKLFDTSTASTAVEMNAGELLNQKRIATAIQNDIDNIQMYSTEYNAKGYKQALRIGDLRIVYTQPFYNESVVNLMATLLNSDVVAKSFDKPDVLVIPEIKVPEEKKDIIAILMHKRTYQFFYAFNFMGSFFDASNLTINNFLHFKYGKGFLDNLPAIEFKGTTLPKGK